jgi:hypothetical protein
MYTCTMLAAAAVDAATTDTGEILATSSYAVALILSMLMIKLDTAVREPEKG